MPKLEIVTVERPSHLAAFINLPWKIYRNDPNWVPPLKRFVRHMLDTRLHPFWKFSQRVLFLARRGSEVLGRIAGIIDNNYNKYHRTGRGTWGFFECQNDAEAAHGLFDAVADWVREKGMTHLCGPFNPSTNYEIGLLTEGFEHRATFMMPYNPRYYVDLVESWGFYKEKELLSYIIDDEESSRPPGWMATVAQRIRQDPRYTIRHPVRENLRNELAVVKAVYDESWAENWGFVPMTEEEISEMGKNLARFADPDLIFFIYRETEPVAVAVAVPDINPLLQRLNGSIGLTGLLKMLFYRNEVNGIRGLLFGIKSKYREQGLPFLALDHAYNIFRRQSRYRYLELGWNLEDNQAINQFESEYGARVFKRYRIYRKSFADRW